MKMLIVGVGYLGSYVLQALGGKCEKLWGTTRRSDEPVDSSIIKFDEHSLIDPSILEDATHVLSTIPPVDGKDLLLSRHAPQLISSKKLKWLGYCSTTGVYGDTDGAWVDEQSLCLPRQMRSIERKCIEDQWIELFHKHDLPIHIFRLSGIYGPNRSMVKSVVEGKARRIDKAGQVFSRIHVEDIVAVLTASMNNPQHGEVYNLSDDGVCSSNEIIEYVCQELSLPLPPLVSIDSERVSEISRSFYAECRRVSNHKIKTKLGITLKYPTYKQGLQKEINLARAPG